MRDAPGIDGVKPPREAASVVRFAGLVLSLDACTLARDSGDAIPLTHGEFALLRMFVARPGRVFSRDTLLDAFTNRRFEPFDRSVDVLVGRLRRKIEADPKRPRLIVTVPGEGYRFDGQRFEATRDDAVEPERTKAAQTIQYCRAPDGVRVAYAISGSGPFLVKIRQLDEPSRIRLGKPDFAPCLSRAVARAYTGSLRRERQWHVRLGR